MATPKRISTRQLTYIGVGLLIIWGGSNAQGVGATSINEFDLGFWFRALLSGMLAILIFMAKGTDATLKEHTQRLNSFDIAYATRGKTLNEYDGRLLIIENELKQQMSLLLLLKEMLLTNYHNKEETDKHRAHVERTLDSICRRLDSISRPHHRREDDEGATHHDR
jgi:hypothetical protein